MNTRMDRRLFAVVIVAGLGLLATARLMTNTSGRGGRPSAEAAPTPMRPESRPTVAAERITANAFASTENAALRGQATSLTGRVIDTSGVPIEGALVAIHADPTRGRGTPAETTALTETISNEDGRFTFDGILWSQVYALRVEHDGFRIKRVRPIHVDDPASLNQTVTLQRGADLTGTVRSDDHTPLADVDVSVFESIGPSARPTPLFERHVRTARDGTFRIPAITPGVKRLVAEKAGFATEIVEEHRFGGAADEPPVEIILSHGETVCGRVIDAIAGGGLAGIRIGLRMRGPWAPPSGVTKPDAGTPASSRAVPAGSCERIDPHVVMSSVGADDGAALVSRFPDAIRSRALFDLFTVSGENGAFRFTGLCRAEYVAFIADDTASQGTEWIVHAGETDVTLDIAPGGTVAGRVIDADSGSPVTGFAIAASCAAESGFVTGDKRRQLTSRDGRFLLRTAVGAAVNVFVWANGFTDGYAGPFEIRPNTALADVTIAMHRAARVHGLVTGPRGETVRGAIVTLVDPFPAVESGMIRFMTRRSLGALAGLTTLTDDTGNFTLCGVPAGEFALRIRHAEFAESETPSFVCSGRGDHQVQDTTLHRGAALEGKVLGMEGTTTHVIVRGMWPNAPIRELDGAAGTTLRCTGLPAGTYQILTSTGQTPDPATFLKQARTVPTIELRDGETTTGLFFGEAPPQEAPPRSKNR